MQRGEVGSFELFGCQLQNNNKMFRALMNVKVFFAVCRFCYCKFEENVIVVVVAVCGKCAMFKLIIS